MTFRRVLFTAFAAVWAVMSAAPAGANSAGRLRTGADVTVRSAIPASPNLITDAGRANRVLRSTAAIKVNGTSQDAVDDDDEDVDTDESKRSGHERYSAVLPRAPDAGLDTFSTPHVSRVSSLVVSASVACPQGRAPPSLLS